MKKLPSELTSTELEKAVRDLTQFCEFTFFEERGVDTSVGLTFALEYMASSLDLIGDWLYEGEYDSAMMMQDLVIMLDKKALEMDHKPWQLICANMPYQRALSQPVKSEHAE